MDGLERFAAWLAKHWETVIFHPVFASLIGAMGASVHAFPGATAKAKATNGFLSFFVAIYGGSLLVEWRSLESMKLIGATYAACALGGLIVINGVLEYLRTTKAAQWPILRGILNPPDMAAHAPTQPGVPQ
jgi:hypothetical protein